jgi:MFS family permease
MDRTVIASLFAASGFKELWIAGGVANAMLWFEVLAAGLFTFQATGSGLAVAIVSAARSCPLLLTGAFIGVLSEAVNRKRIVVGGLVLTALSSVSVGALGLCSVLQPWHMGVAALISGLVYATEMPARRRMISECAGDEARPRAVAVDSMTNYATRCAGPILGGLAYQSLGLPGAFLISAVCSLGAAAVVSRIPYFQKGNRRLPIRRALTYLRDAVAFARASKTLAALLAITVVTNLFGYSYGALVTPLGLQVFKSVVSDGGSAGVRRARRIARCRCGDRCSDTARAAHFLARYQRCRPFPRARCRVTRWAVRAAFRTRPGRTVHRGIR